MRPYSPGGALNTLASAGRTSESPLPSAHRLRPGLPGYLIPFAPLAFVPQRQLQAREPLSPPAFLLNQRISPLHQEFHSPLLHSSPVVSNAIPRLSRGISHQTCRTPTHPLCPVIPNNACHLRITAAAGTKLAVASSWAFVKPTGYSPTGIS